MISLTIAVGDFFSNRHLFLKFRHTPRNLGPFPFDFTQVQLTQDESVRLVYKSHEGTKYRSN